jgi:hypothetical protein
MIRFLLRLLGLVALAIAFFFLVYDGEQFIVNHHFDYTKVSGAWAMVDQSGYGLTRAEALVKQKASWAGPYVEIFLGAPISLVFVIVAFILMTLGRKKKPLIGYARN